MLAEDGPEEIFPGLCHFRGWDGIHSSSISLSCPDKNWMDRKSSKCVVFKDDPRGITAAHNCTMIVVGLIGAHPAYELDQADLAVASYSELSVINLRRLFAHKGSHFMDLQKQIIDKSPPKRKLMTDTIY